MAPSSIRRFLILGLSLLCLEVSMFAQAKKETCFKSILSRLSKDDRPPERPRFLVYPSLGYSPETSLDISLFSAVYFHAKNDFQYNRLSEIKLIGFYTLRSQYGLWIENTVNTNKNCWLLYGRARLQHFPMFYYGIGSDAPKADPVLVEANQILIRQRALRKLSGHWFAGLRGDLQHLGSVDFGGEHPTRPIPLAANGSTNLGIGPSFVFDSRSNMLNSRKGWFAELSWLHYNQSLGSDFDLEVFSADLRHYHSLNATMVLAWQLSGNAVQGNAPFNMLCLIGNEMLMRGYYTGRFRDRHYYAAQAEYRCLPFPFSHRLGGTAFLGAGAVSPSIDFLSTRQIRLAGGAGLRYLIFPQKDVFIRLDLGFTREGMGVYFFTGEAF
jgi:hypothetical protein